MRLQPTRVTTHVRALPASWNHDVELALGGMRFEMTAPEAHALADRLVDAAEKHLGTGGVNIKVGS